MFWGRGGQGHFLARGCTCQARFLGAGRGRVHFPVRGRPCRVHFPEGRERPGTLFGPRASLPGTQTADLCVRQGGLRAGKWPRREARRREVRTAGTPAARKVAPAIRAAPRCTSGTSTRGSGSSPQIWRRAHLRSIPYPQLPRIHSGPESTQAYTTL